jgi:DNA-binding NtrC family response regulator
LRLRGYDPVAVGSGEEALTLLETQAFAVAIIDMGLQLGGGVMDGLELLRRVRESYPSTECVVLTGAPSQKTAIDAVAAGAFGYLLKPFNLTELVGTLERALAHRRESVELSAAQTRAELIKEANQVIVTRLRRECLASLQNLVRLGQDIVESTSLENAQAYGSLVLAEGQAVLDTINELVASTPSGDGKR